MVKSFLPFLLGFSCMVGSASCKPDTLSPELIESGQVNSNTRNENISNEITMNNKIRIKIGSKTFSATLADNSTATAFKALLPLTLNMRELNGNEKYANLTKNLSIHPSVPASIQTGDLMMYGSNTLVLFYEPFSTSYSYTKVGKINDTAGLAAALGSDDIKITFELE